MWPWHPHLTSLVWHAILTSLPLVTCGHAILTSWLALLISLPLVACGLPSSSHLPWWRVACPPHLTSLGEMWHALLISLPLATRGRYDHVKPHVIDLFDDLRLSEERPFIGMP